MMPRKLKVHIDPPIVCTSCLQPHRQDKFFSGLPVCRLCHEKLANRTMRTEVEPPPRKLKGW